MRSGLLVAVALLTACGPALEEVVDPCPAISTYTPRSRRGRKMKAQSSFFIDGDPVTDLSAESLLLENPGAHDEAARSRAWLGGALAFIAVGVASAAGSIALFAESEGRGRDGRLAAGGGLLAGGLSVSVFGAALMLHERHEHLELAAGQCVD